MSAFDDAKALFFEGMGAVQAGDFATAEGKLRRSLELVPDRGSVLTNLAGVLFYLNRMEEAASTANRAVELDPKNIEAWLILGRARHRQGRLADALTASDRLIVLRPDAADLWVTRGALLSASFRFFDAAYAYERALALAPGDELATIEGEMLHARMRVCDWRGLPAAVASISASLRAGKRACAPFPLLSLVDDPALQLVAARLASEADHPARRPRWQGERYHHSRVRVGYLSPDFRAHPVAQLIAGLFERHDRTRFEVIGLAVGGDDGSPMRMRIAKSVDQFIDTSGLNEGDVARLIRQAEVDVLVDLAGYTQGTALGVLAERPAPVQVSYLGHPGTSGARYVDYIIADDFVVPPGSEGFYSEKIVRLPDCFQVNDDRRILPEPPTRDSVGLPDRRLVLCCFNNTYKINPDIFGVWMRLLTTVADSVLWLVADEEPARDALRGEAETRGVAGERLIFAERAPYEHHLARLRLADLFLDTLPFNAGATASDALFAGVPLVTCVGASYAARMAGSLLHAMGLPELITTNLRDYETVALRLAQDTVERDQIRSCLQANRTTAALFDTSRFCRNIETAYEMMLARAESGLMPEDMSVSVG